MTLAVFLSLNMGKHTLPWDQWILSRCEAHVSLLKNSLSSWNNGTCDHCGIHTYVVLMQLWYPYHEYFIRYTVVFQDLATQIKKTEVMCWPIKTQISNRDSSSCSSMRINLVCDQFKPALWLANTLLLLFDVRCKILENRCTRRFNTEHTHCMTSSSFCNTMISFIQDFNL